MALRWQLQNDLMIHFLTLNKYFNLTSMSGKFEFLFILPSITEIFLFSHQFSIEFISNKILLSKTSTMQKSFICGPDLFSHKSIYHQSLLSLFLNVWKHIETNFLKVLNLYKYKIFYFQPSRRIKFRQQLRHSSKILPSFLSCS